MIQNPDFLLCTIGAHEYLLPSGNAIVANAPIQQLVGSARAIWELHHEDIQESVVLQYMYDRFQPENYDEMCELRTDTRMVYNRLVQIGALIEYQEYERKLHSGEVISSDEMRVTRGEDGYEVELHEEDIHAQLHLTQDPSGEAYDLKQLAAQSYADRLIQRVGFSRKALAENKIFLHSVSVLYRERLWVFAAAAGVGKSTHARMWEDAGVGTIINGDLNLLGLDGDVVMAYGTPWCGTSEQFSLENYPVGGVIILTRGYKDYIEELGYEEKVLGVLSRSISPRWNTTMLAQNLAVAEDVVKHCMVCKLRCTTEPSALQVMKAYMDHFLGDDVEEIWSE